MEEPKFDDAMIQDLLDWLSRNVQSEDEEPLTALKYTEEDCEFLRQSGIAAPI